MDKSELGDYMAAAEAFVRGLAEEADLPLRFVGLEEPCSYCSLPEEYDACPVHRDGE